MKRTDGHVDLELYAAVFRDIATWDSNLRQDLALDFIRLDRTVCTRGVSFLMIDMPEASRTLEKALSTGTISSINLPNTFGKVVDRGTREFLSCLFELVFDGMGHLRHDVNPTAVFFLRQVLNLSKKVKEDCSDAAISAEVENFRKVDGSLRKPSLDWELDTLNFERPTRLSFTDGYVSESTFAFDRSRAPRPLLRILDQVCGIVISQFPELDWREVTPRHGTGAVADAQTGTDKYLFKYWPNKLEGTFPYTYFAQHREDLHFEETRTSSPHEPPARLLAVPKTLKGPRLIASEPTAHQYLQQALMKWLRAYLPATIRPCINFLSQEPSRQLCLQASETGDLGTVDLSSASDRLSCWVVERVFQYNPGLLRALHSVRTRWIVNSTGVGEKFFMKVKKFAAQGSAVTFPVQTIVYTCIALACMLYEDGVVVNRRNILVRAGKLRVFGDDIIMPSYAVPSLALLMTHCELKVNASKTHYQGLFRESCGMDAYAGVCVTPVYLRALELGNSPQDLVSWVDVCNNAYSKGLWHLSDAMVRKIPVKIRKLIPVSSEDLGVLTLRSFQPMSTTGRTRLCRNLHREETLGLSPQVKAVSRKRESSQNLLQYFVEDPSPLIKWTAGFLATVRFSLKKRWVLVKQPG